MTYLMFGVLIAYGVARELFPFAVALLVVAIVFKVALRFGSYPR